MAQKDIEGCHVTWWHMHVILRWLNVRREIEFEAEMIRILSHLRIFELKKVSHLRILTRDQYFEQKLKRNWMVRTLSHLKITYICYHVTWHSSMSFWAFSKYLPYLTISTYLLVIILNYWYYVHVNNLGRLIFITCDIKIFHLPSVEIFIGFLQSKILLRIPHYFCKSKQVVFSNPYLSRRLIPCPSPFEHKIVLFETRPRRARIQIHPIIL